MLTRAVGFVDGVSEVPEGWMLFLSYEWVLDATGRTCRRGEKVYGSNIEGVRCHFGGNRLHVDGTTLTTSGQSRILICEESNRKRGGLSTVSSGARAIDGLPETLDGDLRLRAVDKHGTIVIEIDGVPYYIHPSDHWQRMIETQDNDCDAIRTDSLTNYGLLRDEQIEFGQ